MRNYDIGLFYDCYEMLFLELYSDVEIDRFDISNGSCLGILENVDVEKDKFEKNIEYEDIDFGVIDFVLSFIFRKQFSIEEKFKKFMEVILDVLFVLDVRVNYSDRKENFLSFIRLKDVDFCELSFEFF